MLIVSSEAQKKQFFPTDVSDTVPPVIRKNNYLEKEMAFFYYYCHFMCKSIIRRCPLIQELTVQQKMCRCLFWFFMHVGLLGCSKKALEEIRRAGLTEKLSVEGLI